MGETVYWLTENVGAFIALLSLGAGVLVGRLLVP